MIQYPKLNYVVWDLETSGLDPVKDKIIEIGFMLIHNGEVARKESMLINNNIQLSQKTIDLTGISQEMVDAGMEPDLAYGALREVIENYPHVTHNGLRFDIPFFLESVFTSTRVTVGDFKEMRETLKKNCIDTAVIFKANKLNMPRRFNETFEEWGNRVLDVRAFGLKYNVKVCCDELGIPVETQHRAGDDVLLTNEIYKKLCLNQ